ncbi:MAG: tRNA adenosine(34) deaminase TadA [Lactobacillus sp.]|jgi:tRNA(adenine34) deaminase
MFTSQQKEEFMQAAMAQARLAQTQDEIPIGAVVVDQKGQIIGRGYNRRELDQDACQHAELIAIRQACQALHSWRLIDCSLFVTLEPCAMCAGAIINARLKSLVFGALDPKAGACGSVVDLLSVSKFNHHPQVIRGFYRAENSQMLKNFFRAVRAGRQQKPGQKKKNKLS